MQPQDGFMTSKHVSAAARAHFNCSSAKGAPLETQGGEGTEGMHWDAAALLGDIMASGGASRNSGRRMITNVTMALARDSGWYAPNVAIAGVQRRGLHAGCAMLVRIRWTRHPATVVSTCARSAELVRILAHAHYAR